MRTFFNCFVSNSFLTFYTWYTFRIQNNNNNVVFHFNKNNNKISIMQGKTNFYFKIERIKTFPFIHTQNCFNSEFYLQNTIEYDNIYAQFTCLAYKFKNKCTIKYLAVFSLHTHFSTKQNQEWLKKDLWIRCILK